MYKLPKLLGAALAFLLSIGSLMKAQESINPEVSDKEIELIAQFSSTKFAYIPEKIRALVVALQTELKNCSPELLEDLCHEAHIAPYTEMAAALPHIIEAVDSKRPLMRDADYENYKQLLASYNTSLQNGEALITVEPDTRSTKSKTVCSLIAKRRVTASQLKVCGNAQILGKLTIGDSVTLSESGGTLTIDGGLRVTGLLATGAVSLNGTTLIPSGTSLITGSGAMVSSSLIPFSSGLVTTSFATILNPEYIGFGSSSINGPNFAVGSPIQTAYAFSIPQAGTLHHLQATVDLLYAINTLVAAPQQSFTFTLLKSPCNNGSGCQHAAPNAYTPLLSTTICFSAFSDPILVLTPASGCNQNTGSVSVAAGDRIVLQVSANPAPVPLSFIFALAFSAGVFFTPA